MKVYTGGTFDLFHAGHVELLAECRKLAGPQGTVFVGLNLDRFITEYKGEAPVMNYNERETVLKACKYVDFVVPNAAGADSKPAILSVSPDYIAIGSDWAGKDYYSQMGFDPAWLKKLGISLLYIPRPTEIKLSTSVIKTRLRSA